MNKLHIYAFLLHNYNDCVPVVLFINKAAIDSARKMRGQKEGRRGGRGNIEETVKENTKKRRGKKKQNQRREKKREKMNR